MLPYIYRVLTREVSDFSAMAVFFLLFAILGCALARPSSENVTPVEVTLYYEALCPGCRVFIPNQLYPAYTDTKYDFASLISKLTLVPYGWAHVKNATAHDYSCQHGPAECDGNRLHSCALEHIPDPVTALGYISCLDDQDDSLAYPIEACQDKLTEGLYSKIIDCYESEEGWTLIAKNGEKTTSFFEVNRSFIPYVSFNNKQDDDLAMSAVDDFRGTLCKLTGVADKACSS